MPIDQGKKNLYVVIDTDVLRIQIGRSRFWNKKGHLYSAKANFPGKTRNCDIQERN